MGERFILAHLRATMGIGKCSGEALRPADTGAQESLSAGVSCSRRYSAEGADSSRGGSVPAS